MAGSRRTRNGTVVRERLDSRALRGNALGDPSERDVYVYLPPQYDTRTKERFPVVHVITGFTGMGVSPWQYGFIGEALQDRMDRLIRSRKVPPMILVTPDCMTALGGSQYVDSAAVGRYETFVVREVVPFVDEHFRTKAAARHRAICGKSSGGYGALMLGMKHPRVFGALASHSGDAYFDTCYRLDFVKCWNQLNAAGGVERWLKRYLKSRMTKLPGQDFPALNIVAMAACYSPDANEPWGFALPFDLETGEVREDVMRRWRRRDPVFAAKRYAKNLRSLRGIFIDCGLRDEWALHIGARVLSKRLRELGVAHVHEEFDDGHMGISYRYDRSFPLLGKWIS
jgi:enterochelin esterase family protein